MTTQRMHKRCNLWRKHPIPPRNSTPIKQPSHKNRPIRIPNKPHCLPNNSPCNPLHLLPGRKPTLKTRPHRASPKSSRPTSIHFAVMASNTNWFLGVPKRRTALDHVVAKGVKEQRRGVRTESGDDNVHMGGGGGEVDYFLDRPGAILVDAYDGHMGGDGFEKEETVGVATTFEDFLKNNVANVICFFIVI
ncbi:hypothetical protein BC829DRAFT_297226 [Chytridium lagenaria]|nr:hypothetical protein BC829DRAFT_297226 [Chytridium lagenaria]